jgi:hypothetical protein
MEGIERLRICESGRLEVRIRERRHPEVDERANERRPAEPTALRARSRFGLF